MNDMVDFRTRLEYNWSWEESGATSLSSERVVEVLTHPVLLAPPISKPTFTVAKWQAISAGRFTKANPNRSGVTLPRYPTEGSLEGCYRIEATSWALE